MSMPKVTARPRLAAVRDTAQTTAEVSAARWATPCRASQIRDLPTLGQLIPTSEEIPAEYPGRARWAEFADRLITGDIAGVVALERDGVAFRAALWHLGQVLTSPGLDRTHRVAALAWLASLWLSGWVQDDSLLFDEDQEDADEDDDGGSG